MSFFPFAYLYRYTFVFKLTFVYEYTFLIKQLTPELWKAVHTIETESVAEVSKVIKLTKSEQRVVVDYEAEQEGPEEEKKDDEEREEENEEEENETETKSSPSKKSEAATTPLTSTTGFFVTLALYVICK